MSFATRYFSGYLLWLLSVASRLGLLLSCDDFDGVLKKRGGTFSHHVPKPTL